MAMPLIGAFLAAPLLPFGQTALLSITLTSLLPCLSPVLHIPYFQWAALYLTDGQ